jgi:hypothetical protein
VPEAQLSPALAYLASMQSSAYLSDEDRRGELDVRSYAYSLRRTRQEMAEREALVYAMRQPPGADVAAKIKKILDAADDLPAPPEPPTPFQSPNDYQILLNLRKRIESTAARTQVAIPAGIQLGTLPMGDVEANTWPFAKSNEYLIAVREGVFSFNHVLGDILLSAMEVTRPDGSTVFTPESSQIAANVAAKPDIVQRFDELLDVLYADGNAWRVPYRPVAPTHAHGLGMLINSAELFVLCHEIAHITLGHFETDPDRGRRAATLGLSEAFLCEYEADTQGMHDALAVMGANFGGEIRQAASGIVLMLTGLDLCERGRAHYAHAEPSRPSINHPPYRDRRAAIYARWRHYPMSEQLLRGAAVIEGGLEAIWSAFVRQRPAVAAPH